MQNKVFIECTVTPHIYEDNQGRELIEEDILQSIIRQHGKLISCGWAPVLVDGFEMRRFSAVYLERWHD
jgi:hypothetical protein